MGKVVKRNKKGRMKGIVANNHWRRTNLWRGSFVPRKSLLGHTGARIIVKPGWKLAGSRLARIGMVSARRCRGPVKIN